ncbi:MAG: hypothetical protein J5493_05945 [Lachnospiraceae bacterium]|nr:hypothetical protein [Lachnospiraceae bacterium]
MARLCIGCNNKISMLDGSVSIGGDGLCMKCAAKIGICKPCSLYNTSIEQVNNRFEFTLYILNQYYVLLTRGIDGIRLGFWDNDAFREYMEKTLDIK